MAAREEGARSSGCEVAEVEALDSAPFAQMRGLCTFPVGTGTIARHVLCFYSVRQRAKAAVSEWPTEKELAPRARFELATLRLTVAALICHTECEDLLWC